MFLDEPTNGLDPAGRDEMLDLVRRTGKEFGISIIMASHLLGEIERVCEQLVVIDAGRLVRSGPIGSFTEQTGTLAVEVDGDGATFAQRLRSAGLEVVEDGRLVLVGLNGKRPYDLIRDAADDLGVGLVRLEQRRTTLEDLFKDPDPLDQEDAVAAH